MPAECPALVQTHHIDPPCGQCLKASIWFQSVEFVFYCQNVPVSGELWLFHSWTTIPVDILLQFLTWWATCSLLFIPHVFRGNSFTSEGQKKCFKHSVTTGLKPLRTHNSIDRQFTQLCYVGHLRKQKSKVRIPSVESDTTRISKIAAVQHSTNQLSRRPSWALTRAQCPRSCAWARWCHIERCSRIAMTTGC